MRDGPRSPYKVVWFAKFREGMPRDEAVAHWRDVHAPIALRAPGIDRYVQNLAVASMNLEGIVDELPAFDGFSECWYADRDAYLRSQESEAWDELAADGFNVPADGRARGHERRARGARHPLTSYSAALRTIPLARKSARGGAKTSTSHDSPSPVSCEVCSTPAGMIVTLGAPQRRCASSRHAPLSGVHG